MFYVLLIFVFALIYMTLPARSFFHATMMYERDDMIADSRKILDAIEGYIRDAFVRRYGSNVASFDGWRVDINDLDLTSIDVKDYAASGVVGINSSIMVMHTGAVTETVQTTLRLSVSANLMSNRVIVEPGTVLLTDTQFGDSPWIGIAGIPAPPRANQLLATGFDQLSATSSPRGLPMFAVSRYLYGELVDFGEAFRGFPRSATGQFWRMLYLSSGIATSAALGDIVPLTWLARMSITVQSLLCILVIALFLDSLVRRIGVRAKE
ncbi:MAG: hypothetical protein U0X20_08020 [Caldilineaceae bacterium]